MKTHFWWCQVLSDFRVQMLEKVEALEEEAQVKNKTLPFILSLDWF